MRIQGHTKNLPHWHIPTPLNTLLSTPLTKPIKSNLSPNNTDCGETPRSYHECPCAKNARNQTRILNWHSQTRDDREYSLDLPALSDKEDS